MRWVDGLAQPENNRRTSKGTPQAADKNASSGAGLVGAAGPLVSYAGGLLHPGEAAWTGVSHSKNLLMDCVSFLLVSKATRLPLPAPNPARGNALLI